jgi:hypothetical protein
VRPVLDQRIVDAWLYGPTLSSARAAMERIEKASAARLSEGERVRLEDLPEVR